MQFAIKRSTIIFHRFLSSQSVTENLCLFTDEPRKIKVNKQTLWLVKLHKLLQVKHDFLISVQQESNDRPLIFMLPWLLSQPRHYEKLCKFYTDKGFDVLTMRIDLLQFFLPVTGVQVVAGDVVKFLKANDYYKEIIIHGFSFGGYLWSESLIKMQQDIKNNQSVIDRIKGQIWDSKSDIPTVAYGLSCMVPYGLQRIAEYSLNAYMKIFYNLSTRHYIKSAEMMHDTIVKAPALFIVSKADPIGTEKASRIISEKWKLKGIPITFKSFDKSPHVLHFKMYKNEYLELIENHLKSINMLKR